MIDLHAGRVDTRPDLHLSTFKGKQLAGAARTCAIQTETVWRRLGYCGKALELSLGEERSRRYRVTCPGCLHELRLIGYAG